MNQTMNKTGIKFMNLNFFIYGDPKGQPRPRAFARKMGAKYVARVYDSDVADEWKRAVDLAIVKECLESKPIFDSESAFDVEAHFFMRRPKSHFSTNGVLKQKAQTLHVQKPDADNLIKLVLDRITRSEKIWCDDSQVSHLTVAKYWADKDENVGCNLTLQPLSTT
jgi:Holliday junction resolvase RusA-like endonuclease